MVRLAVVHLLKYEEWIESLGYDREWKVQAKQAELAKAAYELTAGLGGFAIPFTYDSTLLVLNGSKDFGVESLKRKFMEVSSLTVKILMGVGSTYKEALEKISDVSTGLESEEPTVVAHVDIDGYLKHVANEGFYEAYKDIKRVLRIIDERVEELEALPYYAGGDNVIVFIPHKHLDKVGRVVVEGAKTGVGVAEKPRDALALAARALDVLRNDRSEKIRVLKG